MSHSVPSALIIGIDHFVAKNLAIELLNKDIKVIGVGEHVADLSGTNLEIKMDLEELEKEEFSYVFDFRGETDFWNKIKSGKLTIVCVNDSEKAKELNDKAKNLEINWRLVDGQGVVGPGMEDNWFLTTALKQAASNKNLVLPSLNLKYRLLGIKDLVEAILRASFLSGTEREEFLIVGNEFDSEVVAKILIDEAKMTRFKVIQNDIQTDLWSEEEIKIVKNKLRWQPREELKESIKETLQYFLCRLDEESRRKNKELQGRSKKEEKYEVVVEAEEVVKEEIDWNDFKPLIKNSKLREVTKKIENEEEIIEEDDEPVKEIVVSKNDTVNKRRFNLKLNINLGKWWWYVGGLALILVLLPLNWLRINYLTVKNIYGVEKLIKEKKYDQAEKQVDYYWNKNKITDSQIDDWGLNKIGIIRNYQSLIKVAEDVLLLEKSGIQLAKSGEIIDKAIFQGKTIDWPKELAKIDSNLAEIDQGFGLLQARLGGNWSWLPARFRSWPQNGVKQLNEIKNTVELVKKGIKVLPDLVGADGKKRDYLVLFQNEMELRPTGGFIGSFGILSFENGHLLNLEVKDVYEADGQINGHVEPPEEIKNILGEAGWFMRDANWKASFPLAAADLQWFLDKEIGRKVDGVIGVDLAVARSILGVVGEVYVPDFKEKINKDNLYEQAEYYSEKNFFPGSNQKASFLGGLGKQLFEEIKNLKTDQDMLLGKTIIDLLEKNEIIMALNQKESAKIMADLGWDGAMYQGKCALENCLADYLYLVEANLGVNKVNYFLYRNIEEQIDISTGSIARIVKINYENTAKNTNWPGGDYKNYLRVYLPIDINLAQVSVTDVDNPDSRRIYGADELKIRQEGNKKEVGFLVVVPANKKRLIEIRYSSGIDLSQKTKFSYLNYVQKQPGFGDTGLVTLISYPAEWQPTQVQPAASLVGGKLLFNQKLDRDIKMGVELGK
ncbi:MAG: DUF4012 domain-containing protein [Candidatus Shapirobacteria bacterium]|nr:DUF4012 domain-containing protein [Candidatus Shapirobacteria bacterium]